MVAQEVLQCDELIEDFLEELDENCSEFDLNRACYGTNLVTAEFLSPDDLPENYFTEPSDIAELLQMSNLSTNIFNPEVPEWGIAVLNVQANIPNTIPGQAVKVLLMGAMEMENSVEPDEAFISERSVRLTLTQNSIMRYFPRSNSDFVQTIPAGVDVLADALSTNRSWVRVAYDDIPGWIAVSTLDEASQERLVALPMIEEDARSPMQAFYFETGISQSGCANAPTTLVVQGPEDYAVDIVANGADIRIDSTIILRTNISPGEESAAMEVITLSGEARVFPDTENEIVVPAGEILVSCLTTEEQDLGIDDRADDREVLVCESRELTADEIAEFNYIQRVSSGVLNYEVVWPPEDLYTPTPTPTELATEAGTETLVPTLTPTGFACAPRTDWTGVHIVSSGQTLSGIASSYATDMFTLAEANCLTNPDLIIPGQQLRVPFIPTPIPTGTNLPPMPTPVPPVADLQVTIAASTTSPLENNAVTFTITASNIGQADLSSITVSDNLNGLTARYAFGAPGASTGTYTFATGTWTIPSLGVGSSATVVIPATVRPTSAGLALNSTANGSIGSPSESNTGNNSSTATVNVGFGDIIVNANTTAIANDGICTLREAITAANSDTASGNNIGECRTGNGADTIIMQAASPYNVADAPFAGLAFPTINSDITLNANGNNIVQTAALTQMFSIQTGATVVINNLILTDSIPAGSSSVFISFGNVTINNSTITGFRMDFGIPVAFGGGTGLINNSSIIDNCGSGGGQLTWSTGASGSISNSTVSDSNANACASGIRVNGNVTIDTVAISGHRWNGAPNGAGVYIDDSNGVGNAIIQNSTITNNRLGVHAATGGTANITGTDFTGTITDDCFIAGGTITSDGTNTTADADCP